MSFIRLLLVMALAIYGSDGQGVGARCRAANGQQGTCISIRDCSYLRTLLLQSQSGSNVLGEIRRSICHLGSQPYVCCPTQTSPEPPPPVVITPGPDGRTGSHPLLPTNCGIQGLTDRIIGGRPAELGAWPWMVILRGNADGGNSSSWICGGTLISDRYVLTAAHCVDENAGIHLEFVRIGEHTLSQNPDCNRFGKCAPPPQDILVERIIKHHSYDRPCRECNDIALLRLARTVRLNPVYVTPICLPVNPLQDMGYSAEEFDRKVAWATGWGSLSQDPRSVIRPDVLHQVQLRIESQAYCENQKKNYPDKSMVMCAGDDGKDTCRGDSGGPLTLTNTGGSRYYLVGVTSKGPRVCAAAGTQGLFTSVHHYIPWILNNLEP